MSCACLTRGVHIGGGCVHNDTVGVVPGSGSGFGGRGNWRGKERREYT